MAKAYLEANEVERMEQKAAYLRDKLLIRLLFRLGCRISEALGLSVDDIDFNRGLVTIEHLKVRLRLLCPECGTRLSKKARFCLGCGAEVAEAIAREKEHRRVRSLPLDDDTLKMLRDYIKRGGAISKNGRKLLFGINRHGPGQYRRHAAQHENWNAAGAANARLIYAHH